MTASVRVVRGFTIVELMIVVVITGILTMFGMPLYKEYTLNSIATEGRALLRSIAVKQKLYYSEHHAYYGATSEPTAWIKDDVVLKVNGGKNRYFKEFKYWTVPTGTVFNARTHMDSGSRHIELGVTLSPGNEPKYATINMY